MVSQKPTVLMQEMTWPEYAARIQESIVLLPVGSTEQHGPHLPLGTDAMQVTHIATRVAERLGAVVAPTIPYGYRSAPRSGGGEIFPGTTSLTGITMTYLVRDLLKAFIRHGARRIAVVDGHYENAMFLHEAIHLALEESGSTDVRIIKISWFDGLSSDTLNLLFDGTFPGWALEHAAHIETSTMMVVRPDLVRKEQIRPDGVQDLPLYDAYPQPGDVVPASGVLADPSRATPAFGQTIVEEAVARVADAIRRAFS